MCRDQDVYFHELNDILIKHKLESKYQFTYTIWPDEFTFELEEIHDTGQAFIVFNSGDPLAEDIEEKYESGKISYKEVIFKTIKRNINIHIDNLSRINNLLFIEKENFKNEENWIEGCNFKYDTLIDVKLRHKNSDLNLKDKTATGQLFGKNFYFTDGLRLNKSWEIVAWRPCLKENYHKEID